VQVNAKMKAELRHIVLLLDNAPTHPPDTTKEVLMGFDVYRLSNITLIFSSQPTHVHRAATRSRGIGARKNAQRSPTNFLVTAHNQ
jgi:hypothetical protein